MTPRSQVLSAVIAPFIEIPTVLADLGLDPPSVFADAGVDLRLFEQAHNRMLYPDIGRLVEVCVRLSGCEHFGLLVGQRFRLAQLGAIGQLLRHSPTSGRACRSLVRHLHLQDQGVVPFMLELAPSQVALGLSVLRFETPAIRQINDGCMAILLRLLRELCGPTWKPLEVRFAHSRPLDLQPYRQFFGCRLRFNADFSAVLFETDWLARSVAGADPLQCAALEALISEMENARQFRLADKVRRALQSMVLSGTASTRGIAELFDLHERSLRRQLKAQGTSVNQLVQEALFEVAQQLLGETRMSVSDIAAALHYADTAAFSNAFRRWAGSSPRSWRQARLQA
jgi:AraC-like DNA-binding protein